jgi:hypothetical protein
MFVHVVLFWLREDAPAHAAQQIIDDCRGLLAQIPQARHVWAGSPAMTPRPVVDNSYHVGLCVVVDDRAGHDAYQMHPLHQQFIARNKDLWTRVQVYDFE